MISQSADGAARYHFTLAFGLVPVPGATRSSSDTFSPGTVPVDPSVTVPCSDEAHALTKKITAKSKTVWTAKRLITPEANHDCSLLKWNLFPDPVNYDVTNAAKIDIKSLELYELQKKFQEQDEPSYRAKQITDWLYTKRASSFGEMSDVPRELRERLEKEFSFARIDIVRVLGSRDTTRKFLFRLNDGDLVESVLIPASPALYGGKSDRRTICISTQVGCAYGCKFCASGLEGFSRNLRANEIVDQIIAVECESGNKIDNIVFMGMGEPLANFDNVMRAIRIINAPWGLGVGARHITISTSGLAPQIRNLADEPLQIRLAVSLHGATNEVRDQIMPINRRYNIDMLLSACEYYVARKKQRLSFEYILISGVNDADEQAHLLAQHARRLSAKVNLIPYNTVDGLPWSRPSRNRQEKFLSILRAESIPATLRREKGHDIQAACGQLRLQTKRESQPL